MPGCLPSCPKVRRELKRRNAERKKALEGEAAPSNIDDEREAQELNPGNLEFENYRLQDEARANDEDNYRRRSQSEIKSDEDDHSETISRGARSASSRRRPMNERKKSDENLVHLATSFRREKDQDEGLSRNNRSEDYDPGDYILNQDENFNQPNRKLCSSECCLQKFKEEMVKKQLEAEQKAGDLLHKDINYFKKFCICSSMCLAKQLWYDPFVKKIVISASLFALGIKLCCEMDAWYIPT